MSDRKFTLADLYDDTIDKDREDKRLSDIMKTAQQNTNLRDSVRYFNPKTTFSSTEMPNSYAGYVDKPSPTDVHLNSNYYYGNDIEDTIAHEATHSDEFLQKRKYDRILNKFIYETPKRDLKSLLSSYNANDNDREQRANLRAAISKQPYGTKEEDVLKPLLDATEGKVLLSYPNRGKNTPSWIPMRTTDRDTKLKLILQDLFPRERWIEPKPPTLKEQFLDWMKRKGS